MSGTRQYTASTQVLHMFQVPRSTKVLHMFQAWRMDDACVRIKKEERERGWGVGGGQAHFFFHRLRSSATLASSLASHSSVILAMVSSTCIYTALKHTNRGKLQEGNRKAVRLQTNVFFSLRCLFFSTCAQQMPPSLCILSLHVYSGRTTGVRVCAWPTQYCTCYLFGLAFAGISLQTIHLPKLLTLNIVKLLRTLCLVHTEVV